jgi:iron(III) transport system substrate-binding protein
MRNDARNDHVRTAHRARQPRTRAIAFAAVIAATALSACGNASATKTTTTITLYSGQHLQTTDALIAGFEQATGIKVQTRSNDENTLVNEIVAEGSRSPADVIFTENSPALEFLAQKHLLARLPTSVTRNTSSKLNSTDQRWVGVSARVSVLVYNPRLITKTALPTTVLGLAAPRFKNKLAIAPGETDFQPIVTSVLRAYGKARTITWLDGVKANGEAHNYSSNEKVVSEVNSGSVAFALIDQYYWYRLRAQIGPAKMQSAIAYLAPHDPGYVLDVSGAAVLTTSKHASAADKFVAYLTSRAGQLIIAHSTSYEYPIASGVTTTQPETPFVDLKPNSITLAQLGTGQSALKLLRDVQLL